jgi:hypothetical protein
MRAPDAADTAYASYSAWRPARRWHRHTRYATRDERARCCRTPSLFPRLTIIFCRCNETCGRSTTPSACTTKVTFDCRTRRPPGISSTYCASYYTYDARPSVACQTGPALRITPNSMAPQLPLTPNSEDSRRCTAGGVRVHHRRMALRLLPPELDPPEAIIPKDV